MPSREEPLRFGNYRVLERIGEGGMCLVFRAQRDDLGMDCALKILKPELRAEERVRDLFLTEADLSLLLRHPNLIRSFDAGEIDGRAFIAMELLEGGTLGDLVDVLKADDCPLPDDLALFVVSEMLSGLEALHEAKGESGRPLGIVHRDVTPHNVFLGLDGRVVLGDYGVAHIGGHGEDLLSEVPGKLAYLPPEALTRDPVDRRGDLFSAGVLLHELLLGRRPFEGEDERATMELIVEGRLEQPRRLRPELPADLEKVLISALERRAEQRPSSAARLRGDLRPFWDDQLGNARILGSLMRSVRSSHRAP
ncbi:MAG: serine/threonine-protein kinase [Myxococcota bacterium]